MDHNGRSSGAEAELWKGLANDDPEPKRRGGGVKESCFCWKHWVFSGSPAVDYWSSTLSIWRRRLNPGRSPRHMWRDEGTLCICWRHSSHTPNKTLTGPTPHRQLFYKNHLLGCSTFRNMVVGLTLACAQLMQPVSLRKWLMLQLPLFDIKADVKYNTYFIGILITTLTTWFIFRTFINTGEPCKWIRYLI